MNETIEMKNFEGRKAVSSIAMTILLVSFSMLFATLLLGYTVFRLTNDIWPPMGMERVDLTLPTLSTIIIAISSFFFYSYEKAFLENNKKKIQINFTLTLAFGLGFMLVQFLLWNFMAESGLYVAAGIFPSLLFSLTWIHAAHIVIALISLLILTPTLTDGYSQRRVTWVQSVGKFWHFLGVVWFFMYVIMFVF